MSGCWRASREELNTTDTDQTGQAGGIVNTNTPLNVLMSSLGPCDLTICVMCEYVPLSPYPAHLHISQYSIHPRQHPVVPVDTGPHHTKKPKTINTAEPLASRITITTEQ